MLYLPAPSSPTALWDLWFCDSECHQEARRAYSTFWGRKFEWRISDFQNEGQISRGLAVCGPAWGCQRSWGFSLRLGSLLGSATHRFCGRGPWTLLSLRSVSSSNQPGGQSGYVWPVLSTAVAQKMFTKCVIPHPFCNQNAPIVWIN